MEETRLRVWGAFLALAIVGAVLFTVADRANAEETPVPYDHIATIGCSNAKQMYQGYAALSVAGVLADTAKATWWLSRILSKGDGPRRTYWDLFNAEKPFDASFIPLCEKARKNRRTGEYTGDNLTVSLVQNIIGEILERDPGQQHFYVFALPEYDEAGPFCKSTGGNVIPLKGQSILAELDALPNVTALPVMPRLEAADVDSGGCHYSEAGKAKIGQFLVEYFDG